MARKFYKPLRHEPSDGRLPVPARLGSINRIESGQFGMNVGRESEGWDVVGERRQEEG